MDTSYLPMDHPTPSKVSKLNSEARREQNRIASRNYRLKRKQKLALLDSILLADEVVVPSPSSNTSQSSQSGRDELFNGIDISDVGIFEAGPALTEPMPDHGWRAQQPNAQQESPISQFLLHDTIAPTTVFVPSRTSIPSHEQGLEIINASSAPRPSSVSRLDQLPPPPPQTVSRDDDDALLSIMEGVQKLTLQQKRDLLKRIQHQTTTEVNNSNPPGSALFAPEMGGRPNMLIPSPPFQIGINRNWMSTNGMSHQEATRLWAEARRFGNFVNAHMSSGFSPLQLCRIYSLEVSLFGALYTNCYALGMHTIESVMGEEGVSVFSLDQNTGHPLSQLAMVRSKFKEITPDLQPCDEQLIVGHHPYLDILPFKSFRGKALKALKQNPPLFDEDELCFDFCGGGLICWGSQQNSMGMEAGVPWDARSWEPQVWFLRKYWYLVGGWDDEMWKAARWWHGMRGESINMHSVESYSWTYA